MAYLVELPVGVDGGQQEIVTVAIEESGDGLVKVARPGQVVARASQSLGDMLAGIRPVAQNFVDGFRGMPHAPDEIGVEFGLTLSADANVIISSTAAQANFTVSLTWHGTPDAAGSAEPGAPHQQQRGGS